MDGRRGAVVTDAAAFRVQAISTSRAPLARDCSGSGARSYPSSILAGSEIASEVRPPAGLTGLSRLPEGIDTDGFARRLLAPPHRACHFPGSAHGQPNHTRPGVGAAAVRLDEGLARLARLLENWNEGS